jgi:hypothetical protein
VKIALQRAVKSMGSHPFSFFINIFFGKKMVLLQYFSCVCPTGGALRDPGKTKRFWRLGVRRVYIQECKVGSTAHSLHLSTSI